MRGKKIWIARVAVSVVLIITGLYVVCLLALTLAQRRLMYFPCLTSQAELRAAAKRAGFEEWFNSEGQGIGWQRRSRGGNARRCILLFHGNAGCAPDRFHYADAFQAVEPIDFFIMEYPGYGGRPGKPSQSTILRAADDALKAIPATCSLHVVAESLGTGVAAWLAATYPDRVRGLFLVAPYTSMSAAAQKHLPLFPVKVMLRDKYPASEWLKRYSGPVAVLLAGKDEVVPTELGQKLFDAYHGPKKLWIEADAGHNEVHEPRAGTWREVLEFWDANAR
ncbi:MAG: alpha/beta hydrolase [Verrucomicrobia subdivision 3 bacterium]|nr:alpha/beta hydrolase [Limisphaerales bacterium]